MKLADAMKKNMLKEDVNKNKAIKLRTDLDKYIQKWQTEMFHAIGNDPIVDELIISSGNLINKIDKILRKLK